MPVFQDLTGQRFFRWTVLGPYKTVRTRSTCYTVWWCRCQCGKEAYVSANNLVRKASKSCGCWMRESTTAKNTTHGMRRTKIYGVWCTMLSRCKDPTGNYGGRGIGVCERWRHSFVSFLEDMGPRPSPKHTLERIDNNGDYTPENCRWATRIEQGNNKRNNHIITWQGKRQTLAEWSREIGMPLGTLWSRLMQYHMTVHDAFTKPQRKPSKRSSN
jgi:hypothetical protein